MDDREIRVRRMARKILSSEIDTTDVAVNSRYAILAEMNPKESAELANILVNTPLIKPRTTDKFYQFIAEKTAVGVINDYCRMREGSGITVYESLNTASIIFRSGNSGCLYWVRQAMADMATNLYQYNEPWVEIDKAFHQLKKLSEMAGKEINRIEKIGKLPVDVADKKNSLRVLQKAADSFAQNIAEILTEMGRPPHRTVRSR